MASLTQFPNYYTKFVQPNGKIDDSWYRSLILFRSQIGDGFTVVSGNGINASPSSIGPGDILTITNTGVLSTNLTQPDAGIVFNDSGATKYGAVSYTFSLVNDLAAIESISGTGLATRIGADTWETRNILGTPSFIDVANGDGVVDSPQITISPTYAGQTSITTLGSITTVESISSPAFISFDTTTNLNTLPGRLTWSDFEGTLSLGLKGGNVSLQLGQEMVMRGYNRTGSTIENGKVVYVLGAHAQELEVGVADNSSYSTSQATIGVATEDILNNADGFFTTHGQVHDLNTSSFSEGDELWLGTSGTFTNLRPTAPTQKVNIGYVVRSHPTQGIIFVKPSPAGDLMDLSNVNISTTPTNGQVLTYVAANSRWEASTVVSGSIPHILNEDFTSTYWYSLYSTYIRRINVSVTPFLVQTSTSTDWANRYTLTYT